MKKILLGILTLLLITSCNEYLSEKDVKYMPYKKGEILIFENKELNSLDSIKILRVHRFIPDGPQMYFNEIIEAEIKSGRFVSVHAGYGKHSESYLKIDNISEKFYIKNLENLKISNLIIGTKKLNDVIILENAEGGISKIKKIFWSKSRGIVKYETEKGKIWELKIE